MCGWRAGKGHTEVVADDRCCDVPDVSQSGASVCPGARQADCVALCGQQQMSPGGKNMVYTSDGRLRVTA